MPEIVFITVDYSVQICVVYFEFRHYNYVMNYDCGHLLWEELTVAYVVFWTGEVPKTHTPFCDEIVSKLKLLDTLKANHHY